MIVKLTKNKTIVKRIFTKIGEKFKLIHSEINGKIIFQPHEIESVFNDLRYKKPCFRSEVVGYFKLDKKYKRI